MNIYVGNQSLFFNHNEYICRKPSNQPLKKKVENENELMRVETKLWLH